MSRHLTSLASKLHHRGLAAGFGLVLLKLWLTSAQPIYAIGSANYDDALFISLANYLRLGQWLGPYDYLTLAKGPMYPLFIAANYWTHVPLFVTQQLFYAAACGLLLAAVFPLLKNRWLGFALFVVLLFNPVTFDTVIHARVLRQNILYSLVLLVVAGLVGLYTQRDSAKKMLPWALLTGIAIPAFWLTREEAFWLLPSMVVLWLIAVTAIWREKRRESARHLGCLLLPAVMWIAGLALIAGINLRFYGTFTTCEFNSSSMKAAYGALTRVKPASWQPYLPVTQEMRARIYPLSPTFALLRPELEGPNAESWADVTEYLIHRPLREREIASVWFIWAMRKAVYDTGHGDSSAEAMAFFDRMAREINAACDQGLIEAGPKRSGFLPPMHRKDWAKLPASLASALREIITFDHMSTKPLKPSMGSPEELALFAKLTRGRLIPPSDDPSVKIKETAWQRIRTDILDGVYLVYRWISPWAGGWAVIAWLAVLVKKPWRDLSRHYLWFGAGGFLLSVLALAGVVALIDVMFFPSIETGYFSGAYALWLLFVFFSFHALHVAWFRRKDHCVVSPGQISGGSGQIPSS